LEDIAFISRNDEVPFRAWLRRDVDFSRNDNAVYAHQLQLPASSRLVI